jgi:hypothetical protein
MWKWLGGCLVVLVVLIVAGSWWGYNAMKDNLSPDGTERIMIGASPSRVFASLANGDSVLKWMAEGNSVSTSRRGPLAVGDSLRVGLRTTFGMPTRSTIWEVTEVRPDTLLALRLMSDTSHRVMAIRRDSLSAVGDSTAIVSRVVSPMLDSMGRGQATPGGKPASSVLGLTSDLVLSALRMQSKLDLLRLKAHVEGRRPVLK